MDKVRAVIAAAGRGTRSGLPYPKTLFVVQGKPILVRLCQVLAPIDPRPTVVVSPEGLHMVAACLSEHCIATHLVVQDRPLGMGDAVLRFRESPAFADARDVLLVWGDIPFLQSATVRALVRRHREDGNHFSFATRIVAAPYTVVKRHVDGRVLEVVETRESGMRPVAEGERDIGLFVFDKNEVFPLLQAELDGKWGATTREHGFLYIVRHLADRGRRVSALPIAAAEDLISLNTLADVERLA